MPLGSLRFFDYICDMYALCLMSVYLCGPMISLLHSCSAVELKNASGINMAFLCGRKVILSSYNCFKQM